MAAVTRPGPADARVPCPLCGGLIHPIAGRCKHCKGDLRSLRSARPAAGATLPALNQPSPAPQPDGHAPPATNGHHGPQPAPGAAPPAPPASPAPAASLVQAVAAVAPIPLAIHRGPVEAVPILPPRPTGRFAAPAPRPSWKSWPVIVIVLAVIAIVTAVVLMLFPPGGAPRDEGTNNVLQPAPDRMDTNPTPAPATPRQPPSTSPDPWSRRGGGGGAAPPAPTPPAPVMPPDDPDIDDPDVDDALASRDPFSRRGALGRGSSMLPAIIKHVCSRLSTCGTTNAQTRQLCDLYTRVPSVPPPSCAAAARCLESIDEMSCDMQVTDPTDLWQVKDKFTDCMDALRC